MSQVWIGRWACFNHGRYHTLLAQGATFFVASISRPVLLAVWLLCSGGKKASHCRGCERIVRGLIFVSSLMLCLFQFPQNWYSIIVLLSGRLSQPLLSDETPSYSCCLFSLVITRWLPRMASFTNRWQIQQVADEELCPGASQNFAK